MMTLLTNNQTLVAYPGVLAAIFLLEFAVLPSFIAVWCAVGLFKVYFSNFRFYSVIHRFFVWPIYGLLVFIDAILALHDQTIDLTAQSGLAESILVIAVAAYSALGICLLPFGYFSIKHRVDRQLHPLMARRARILLTLLGAELISVIWLIA